MANIVNSVKKVYNPLLNVSVTGSTIEDFTQNAVVCPVTESVVPDLEQISLNGMLIFYYSYLY